MTKSIRLSIITKSGEGSIELEGDLEPVEGKIIDRFFDSLEAPKQKGCHHKETKVNQGSEVKTREELGLPTSPLKESKSKPKAEPKIIPELNSPVIESKEEKKSLVERALDRPSKKKPKRYFYSTDDGSDKKGVIDSKTRRALESIFLKAEEGEEVTPDDLEEVEKSEVESKVEVEKEEYKGDNSHRDDRYTADITDRNTGKPMEMFRCDYHCPSCGHQDTRFAAIRNSYVKCFKCDTQMALEEAVPGEFSDEFISGLRVPVQDKSGAYFIARDFKE